MTTDVTVLIDDARAYAQSAVNSATPLIEAAQSAITSIVSGPFIVGTPTIEGKPDITIDDTVPEFQSPTITLPVAPSGITDRMSVGGLDFGTAPEDILVAPEFVDPSKPSALRNFLLSPPNVKTDFQFPDSPSALDNIDITPPTITDRTAPDAPNVVLPIFEGTKPTDDLSPPTDYVEQFETAYANMAPVMRNALDAHMDALVSKYNPRFKEQMARLEDKLATYIDGGSALTPAIENQIAERTKGKVDAEYKRVRAKALDDAAKRGFTIPDGALMSLLQDARQDAANNNAAAATEIAVKQAELEQQNIQFAVTTSTQLRSTVLNASVSYYGQLVSLNGQALDYAKSVLGAMIEVYNSLIKAFQAKLELYKAEAYVFETRMRAALAAVEIYKAEIAALEALTRVDIAKIEIYKGRIEALGTLAAVYKAKVETIVTQASLEKMKIDLFGAQVQAYGVEAQAKSAEWQGYSAAVQGQEARFRAFGAQVQAFGSRVDAYRATVQATAAKAEAITSYNRDITAEYAAKVQAYSAVVDANAKIASTQIESNRNLLLAFQAKMSAAEANARTEVAYWQAKANFVIEEFRAIVTSAIETAKVSTMQAQGVADIAVKGADVYKGLAGSALSGINTLIGQFDQQ